MQFQNDQPPGANDATLVAPRAQPGTARLILRRADGQLKEYGLDKDEITIGRLASNDVALPDDRSVSRRHAVIRRSNVGYVIEDQQSNNGTYVDGEKILYPFVLHNGQSIKVGSNELTFTIVNTAVQPAPAGPAKQTPSQPLASGQPATPGAPEPLVNQPIPQPAFEPPPQPAFNAAAQAAPFSPPQPAPAMDQQPAAFPPAQAAPAFQQPPPGPAYQPAAPFGQSAMPEQPPLQGAPAFGAQPGAAGFPAPPSPASSSGSGMVTCQSCGQPTMANKAFCLNCGASLAAQSAAAAPALGGANPFGGPIAGPGPQPWPAQPGQPQAWPQPAQGQPPSPAQQPWPQQPQGWPGQPGQPGPVGAPAPAPAPAAGPLDATVFFSKGLRPLQTSDIRVRLVTQFVAPGGLQPGATITLRIWSTAQDAFYFSGPGIMLRVPAPGGVEEGVLQVTPLRPTAPGAPDQLLLMVVDTASGQPLHPTPVSAEVVISYQPAPPFDGPGSLRLPI